MSTLYHQHVPHAPGIYRIVCISTNKFYLGSAINLYKRQCHHFRELRHNIHHNPKLQSAFNKYGEQAFTFEVLELVLVPEMLTAREQYWFANLKPFGSRGFNIDRIAGSRLGAKVSQQAREKMSAAKRGKPGNSRGRKPSPETIAKRTRSRSGYRPSAQTRERIAQANRGRQVSLETRQKLSEANRGKTISQEQRLKLSQERKGKTQSLEMREKRRLAQIGHSVSPEARQHMRAASASRMKTLIITSPDGTEQLVTGIRGFCQEHGLNPTAIMRVAEGKNTHHHGYKARFP